MSRPPLDGPSALAVRAAQAFSRARRIAYAEIAPDLTVVQASPNLRALMDERVAAVEGRRLTELFWELVGAEAALAEILRGASPGYRLDNVNYARPNGSIAYLTFEAIPLDNEAPAAGLLLIVDDTTHAGRLEQHLVQERNESRLARAQLARANTELERLNRFRSLALSVAVHDLRTPLTAIRGYAELLLKDPFPGTPADRRRCVTTIFRQADRLSPMITNLLNFGQIEQGQLVVKPGPCDLNGLMGEIAEMMKPVAALHGLALGLDLPESPLAIQADAERVRQILRNLIDNAVKYTPEGGSIQIAAWPEDDQVVLQVRDSGRGMTEPQLAQLFQLYYRTEAAWQSKAEGTGLGLFIVKGLVEAHHGQITVASRPGQGTTFTVRLPVGAAAEAAVELRPEIAAVSEG